MVKHTIPSKVGSFGENSWGEHGATLLEQARFLQDSCHTLGILSQVFDEQGREEVDGDPYAGHKVYMASYVIKTNRSSSLVLETLMGPRVSIRIFV